MSVHTLSFELLLEHPWQLAVTLKYVRNSYKCVDWSHSTLGHFFI